MKDIKDYLHLYLGCDCLCVSEFPKMERIATLYSVSVDKTDLHPVKVMRYHDGYKNTFHYQYKFEAVKPILRRLYDMTEEEAKKIILMQDRGYIADWIERGQFEEYPERMSTHYYLKDTYKSRVNDSDSWYDSMLSQGIGQHEVWKYLLSKSFDLFGLIDSGLAIDKKTLKTEKV